jgi:hypothetical protein
MTEADRLKIAEAMDMKPVSEEYEREIASPIRNALTGRLIKLVLIQVQFMKKELMNVMDVIDKLFNANQLNFQLLAIIPTFTILYFFQYLVRSSFGMFQSLSQGKTLKSRIHLFSEMMSTMREIERLLILSSVSSDVRASCPSSEDKDKRFTNAGAVPPLQSKEKTKHHLSVVEYGELLSHVYRIQLLLMILSATSPSVTSSPSLWFWKHVDASYETAMKNLQVSFLSSLFLCSHLFLVLLASRLLTLCSFLLSCFLSSFFLSSFFLSSFFLSFCWLLPSMCFYFTFLRRISEIY